MGGWVYDGERRGGGDLMRFRGKRAREKREAHLLRIQHITFLFCERGNTRETLIDSSFFFSLLLLFLHYLFALVHLLRPTHGEL